MRGHEHVWGQWWDVDPYPEGVERPQARVCLDPQCDLIVGRVLPPLEEA